MRKKLAGIAARAKAKASAMMAQAWKIPPINKMMINWQRSKRLKTVKQLRTYWTNEAHGVEEPREAFVESEDETRATGQPRVIASGDHSCEDDLTLAKRPQRLKAS